MRLSTFSRPKPGRGGAMSIVVVGGTSPIFFSPFFSSTQRWALGKLFLAMLMPVVSMLVGGVFASSLAARRERPGSVADKPVNSM